MPNKESIQIKYKFLKIVPLLSLVVALHFSCKKELSIETDHKLLYVNAFDTVANITFPDYLSLDTSYTWEDYSDCLCCGSLKVRFQDKRDSSFKEHGFIKLTSPPKYKTYVTFIFPPSLKCFKRGNMDPDQEQSYERSTCINLIETDFVNYRAKPVIDFSYINNKLQRMTVMGVIIVDRYRKELNATLYISTVNKRNGFPVIIKFERSSKTSIKDFVNNALRTIHQVEIN